MFDTLSIKELRLLMRELREHHSIKNSSKMKRAELVAALQERFVLRDDGNLYLKEDTRPAKTRLDKAQTRDDVPPAPAKKPRAKKPPAPRDLSHEEVDPLIRAYLEGLDADELTGSTVDELRDAFATRARVNMDEHKKHFRALHRAAVRAV